MGFLDQNDEIDKFKAPIVAKGCSQIYGIDYLETYCSVVQIMSTRLILSYAAMERLKIRQFDIKTAFLYGHLEETIYMTPPDGYAKPDTVWKLNRSIYGLKQSPRAWNHRFNQVLSNLGLQNSKYDNSLFFSLEPLMVIIIYVDDGLIIAEDDDHILNVLRKLENEFEMREMEVNTYRGLQIVQNKDGILIHQEKYTRKVLDTFNMSDAKPANNPVLSYDEQDITPLEEEKPY